MLGHLLFQISNAKTSGFCLSQDGSETGHPWQMGYVEAITVPWGKAADMKHPTGGTRRRRKALPVDPPELPSLHTVADQSESLASDESGALKPTLLELRTLALVLPEMRLCARIPCTI